MADRQVAVELVAKVAGYRAGIGTAIASTKEFRGELDNMRRNSKAHFDQLAMGATIAGTAMLGLVGWATKVGMEFDKQMSEVQAITNATAGELNDLRQAALDAGKATTFSATQAAQAEAELAKAGLTTADILGGALDGALALAAAGSLDLAEAASIAAKTMGQFQLAGEDVSEIADLLAGAANASATDVHELGEALKMGGGAAHAAGMSVEDTTTVFTAFAKQALVGSDAGTSFKTMLMMLQAPTVKASETMAELGINVYDANGNMIDAYGIAGQLQKALSGLTQEERNKAIVTMFGADAQRAANALYAVGADGLHKLNGEMLAQADAARVAQQKTDNLAGDVERLKGSLESLFIESQAGATGPLRFLVQTLDHLVGNFSSLPSGVQQSIFILAGLTGGALLAAVAFVKVRNAVGEAVENLRAAGPVSAKVAGGLETTSKWAMRASLALAGLQVVGLALSAAFDKDLNPQIESLADSLARFGESGKLGGEAARIVGDEAGDLGRVLNGVANSGFVAFTDGATDVILGLVGMDSPMDKAKEKAAALDQALTQMVSSGHADQAAAAFKRIWEEAQRQGISLENLRAAFPEYIAAAEKAAQANATQEQATRETTAENIRLAGAFGEAASAADGLMDAFNRLNGAELSWREAERNAEAAVDDLTEALKESNGSLDVHNAKGRAAAAAVDRVAEAAAAAAQKKYDETQSVEEANAVYQRYIGQLRATLAQAGYTKAQIDALIGSIASMPSTKTVTVNVRVNNGALLAVQNQIRELDRRTMANGGILTFADGGTYENHVAQIAPAGAMRLWAEPETGGEAYIPLAEAKRSRSVATLAEVNRRFDYPLGGGGGGDRTITVIVKDTSGRTLRRELITEALNRNQLNSVVAAAYP